MKTLTLKRKKQIVLSKIIYDYIMNGLSDSLDKLSQEEVQHFVMRVNLQAITYAIDISKKESIEDLEFCFDQLGVSFNTVIPLSELEFTEDLMDQHIDSMQIELGDDFDSMVSYLEKMESSVI